MSKYEELDRAILAAIRDGRRRFYLINAAVESQAAPHAHMNRYAFRIVDGRLQALKRKGLIEYRGCEWYAVHTGDHGT